MRLDRAERVAQPPACAGELASVEAGIPSWAPAFDCFAMLDSAVVRRLIAASGRSRGRVGTLMLFIGLCATLVIRPGLVVCQAGGGHNALEPVWSACCMPATGESSCAAPTDTLTSAADQASTGPRSDRCVDTWLGSPVAVTPTLRGPQQEPPVVAVLGAVASASNPSLCLCTAIGSAPPSRLAREQLTTTVLRV
jgi:hypothetical protein